MQNELENKIQPLKTFLNFFEPRRPGFLRIFVGIFLRDFYRFCASFWSKSPFERGNQQGVAHAWDMAEIFRILSDENCALIGWEMLQMGMFYPL